MSQNIHIEKTADGSDTLYIPELDEHYHSVNGAVQESMHVFIDAGLRKVAKNRSEVSIFEVGFGTGLNAILTLIEAEKMDIRISYTTIELYPLPLQTIEQLNYHKLFPTPFDNTFSQLHAVNWNEHIQINPFFSFEKIESDFSNLDFRCHNNKFDLIYFDAFAPDKQAGMWNQEIFDYLFEHTKPEGALTTYCAKGAVRRMMQQSGYKVERLVGPPGKREMLRASKK